MKQSPKQSTASVQQDFRVGLYARLGLTPKASDQDVESAHRDVLDFLATVPPQIRGWASAQIASADEAFALLAIPAAELDAMVLSGNDQMPVSTPVASVSNISLPNPARKKLIKVASVFILVAVIFGVYKMGNSKDPLGGTAKSDQTASNGAGTTTSTIDQTRVTALMGKIGANPRDIASLQSLGDIYFAATEYKTAAMWETKVLEVDPKNKTGLLALGAAQFNSGNNSEAEKAWLVAADLYPNLAEVHYDLGFLYLSQNPPNIAKVTYEWNKVIKIDPNSSVAKTVATHLKGLASSSSTPASTSSTK